MDPGRLKKENVLMEEKGSGRNLAYIALALTWLGPSTAWKGVCGWKWCQGESAATSDVGNTACLRAGKNRTPQQQQGGSHEATFCGQCFSVQCKLVNIEQLCCLLASRQDMGSEGMSTCWLLKMMCQGSVCLKESILSVSCEVISCDPLLM